MNFINRLKAGVLIPEEVSKEIIEGTRKESAAMQLMRKLPNMSSKTRKMPVLSLLPSADFVSDDGGMKIVTSAEWTKKMLVAGEIAAVIAVPEAVLEDSEYDIWGEVKKLLPEQFGRVFDKQVFDGGNPNAPSEWPTGIIPLAISAGNVVAVGTGTDVLDDLNNVFGVLEEKEYDVTGLAAQRALRTKLRGLRDNNGQFLFSSPTSGNDNNPFGVPIHFMGSGTWNKATATAVAGDWSKAVYSVRKDLTIKIFDTGVLSNPDGTVAINLMQQDMVALRAVMRIAWQVADPVDIDRAFGSSFPFSVLRPASEPPEEPENIG